MAYERTSDSRTRGEGLDVFVENIGKLYANQIAIRNANDEARFQTAVLENNLSLDDQLSYRKEQLKRSSDDPQERRRITAEISVLKDRAEQKKYADAYLEQLAGFQSGMNSIDSLIDWLTTSKANTTDSTVLDSINKSLAEARAAKFTISKNIMSAQTDYAVKDKSEPILRDQITKVSQAKNQALLSGNEELSTALDLQLQALNRSLTENAIQKDMGNLAAATITGSSNAVGLLDAYNAKIASADTQAPITVGGVTYANARDFWTYTRDSYVANSGSEGFFNRINNETSTAIKVKASNNLLAPDDVSAMNNVYNGLYARPELSKFAAKIDAAKQDTIQTAANSLGDKIISEYSNTLDLNGAIAKLNAIKTQGVNVDASMQKILSAATTLKANNIQDIAAKSLQYIADNPGASVADAVSKAIASGAGVVLSPNQILNAPTEQIVQGQIEAGMQGTQQPDRTTTITPQNQPATGLPQPTPLPGVTPPPSATTPGPSTTGTYSIKQGDTLTQIAAMHNTSVSALAALNNISDPNRIQAGQSIKIPTQSTAQPQPVVTQAPVPAAQAPSSPVRTPVAPQNIQPVPQVNPTPTPVSPSVTSNQHTIKGGETLSKIASMYNTTVDALAKLNNIADVNKIYAGKTLKLQ